MAYYTDDYETAMLLQDQDVLNEPLFDTYMFGSSTDQYSQSTAYSSPCLTDITQFDSFDWQLWAELDQFNNSVAPQDDHLRLSPSPEQATPTDPSLLIEELRLKIVELECRVAKVDELECRLSQVEQSTEDVRLEHAAERATLGREVETQVGRWAEQIKVYVESSREAASGV